VRTAFIQTLCDIAEQDERVWLLCGDLGYSVLEPFAGRFAERFVNVGVAEQNMTGIAAGLAMCGKVVFTYSIANFAVLRCLEQIRNDVCYHNLDVKIVAVGGGLAYGPQGYTHHAVEDLAVMQVLPNMTVIAPADPIETRQATEAIVTHSGPCYLRLGKAGEPVVHQTQPQFQIGKAITVQEGRDVTLITTGGVLGLAIEVSKKLAYQGHSARVLSMPTLYPLDHAAIIEASQHTHRIITIEEHGLGGLGSVVAEVLAQIGKPVHFVPVRLRREAVTTGGSQSMLRTTQGLSIDNIVSIATRLIEA